MSLEPMKPPEDPDAELKKTLSEGRAVIVVGTGVSIAASRDPSTGKAHPQASWAGLLGPDNSRSGRLEPKNKRLRVVQRLR